MDFDKKPFIDTEALIFGIGQVSKITGVSSRQLRYWEEQKYISALQKRKGTSRQYSMHTLIRIFHIQRFLSRGFTLQAAVEKAEKIDQEAPVIRDFLVQQFIGVKIEGDRSVLDFGYKDDSKKERVYGVLQNGKASFEIVPESKEE
ncbi:MerR family transcriptional regulator [Lentilactobacillus sp. Marseille-Q4993]|uniref:MerR family transcriptional regulator n=1 Tax=Lentilactobacillus sp. Marseille-Q4993 TaxID=3039492 RepID=UPI0024BC3F81|nr:MerR family transcriptional regulator [Lentilactobacillus sp. Marseille-Q4993]